MWNVLERLPTILVGQSIFSFLDLKSIVRLETALAYNEGKQIFRYFLSYYSKACVEVNVPEEIIKLRWLQNHEFPIKAVVYLDKINPLFDTKMINEIEILGYSSIISTSLDHFPSSFYDKVVLFSFKHNQDAELMEELFSRLHNLRELRAGCTPDGWILSALRGLHRGTNNKVLIEKINFLSGLDRSEFSVAEIAKHCPRLTSLSTGFLITEDSLLALSAYCPLLKELDIRCIRYIPEVSTEHSAALCATALSCIQSISTFRAKPQNNVTQYVMTIPYLTGLRKVVVGGRLDNVLLPLISQHCLQLEEILVPYNSRATKPQILQLVQNCLHLHTVNIYDTKLNNELIVGLAKHCPNLQKLTVNFALDLHDSCLLALSEHCPQLRELILEHANLTGITVTTVQKLIHNCKHLHVLTLPVNCLSEDSVLTLPVTAWRCGTVLTLKPTVYSDEEQNCNSVINLDFLNIPTGN